MTTRSVRSPLGSTPSWMLSSNSVTSSPSKTSKKPTPEENVIRALIANGWTLDRYGHYVKTHTVEKAGKIYKLRCKMQATSIRYEIKGEISGDWINLASDYFKNVVINENGIIIIKGKKLV